MDEIFQKLYDEIRLQIVAFEQARKSISDIKDENFITVKLKEKLFQGTNNILSEYLIFFDLLYQIIDAVDDDEIHAIIDEYELGEEDE